MAKKPKEAAHDGLDRRSKSSRLESIKIAHTNNKIARSTRMQVYLEVIYELIEH